MADAIAPTTGVHHVRLTVTDIGRSKPFYTALFGRDPAADFSGQSDEAGIHEDPARLYGGCAFQLDTTLIGLRPVADAGDSFLSTRVGLDHLSLAVGSLADLEAAKGRLDEAGITHGEIVNLDDFGVAILSLQDPDDINLELSAPLG